MDFLGTDFLYYWIQGHEIDVFEVVVGFGCSLEFFWRFPGVDTLQDAELSEVLEGELKLADGFGPGDVLDDLSSFSGFDFPHYWIVDYIKGLIISYK